MVDWSKIKQNQVGTHRPLERAVLELQQVQKTQKNSPSLSSQTRQILRQGTAQSGQGKQSASIWIPVQFNPAELILDASREMDEKQDANSSHSSVLVATSGRLRLTVKLYFDEMRVAEDFLWQAQQEPKQAGLGQTVQTAALVQTEYSVQTAIEGVLAALRTPDTRGITFRWGDFVFQGTLDTVDSVYTMFSPKGQPVRGFVTLGMVHTMTPDGWRDWSSAMNEMFGSVGR